MQRISKISALFGLFCIAFSGAACATESTVASNTQAEPQVTILVPQVISTRGVLIGRETDKLLAMQRGSTGSRPKPIEGDQAQRSYQRYLKSFEHPIPDAYETGMEVKK